MSIGTSLHGEEEGETDRRTEGDGWTDEQTQTDDRQDDVCNSPHWFPGSPDRAAPYHLSIEDTSIDKSRKLIKEAAIRSHLGGDNTHADMEFI